MIFKKYFIFGSGFGIYGYLPALIKLKKKVYLLRKYKKNILKKKNLIKYIRNINFINKIDYNNIDAVIFAKRPKDQFNFVKKIKKKLFLYLEKPLAENPKKTLKLIEIIKKKKLKFSLGYLFFFTIWFKKISFLKKETCIAWNFKSKTFFSNNWKGINSKGGGIISFYGIHFISIFSYLNYRCIFSSIIKSNDNKEAEWNAVFKKNKLKINLKINIKSKENFIIKTSERLIYKSDTPFGKISINNNKEDFRIKFLKKYLKNLNLLTQKEHIRIIKLWEDVIKITTFTN
jgi:hypothetical protein